MNRDRIVRARKPHRCEAVGGHWNGETRVIPPGDRYLISTVYPGEDGHSYLRQIPMRIKVCAGCAGPARMQK